MSTSTITIMCALFVAVMALLALVLILSIIMDIKLLIRDKKRKQAAELRKVKRLEAKEKARLAAAHEAYRESFLENLSKGGEI